MESGLTGNDWSGSAVAESMAIKKRGSWEMNEEGLGTSSKRGQQSSEDTHNTQTDILAFVFAVTVYLGSTTFKYIKT